MPRHEAEKAFSAQKALVVTLKQQHRDLALRIDASSRWSAPRRIPVSGKRSHLLAGRLYRSYGLLGSPQTAAKARMWSGRRTRMEIRRLSCDRAKKVRQSGKADCRLDELMLIVNFDLFRDVYLNVQKILFGVGVREWLVHDAVHVASDRRPTIA
jgi:hypothetical protein